MSRPVEVTTQFSTSVETLGEAWSFIMQFVDEVGPNPQIEISPVWGMAEDGSTSRRFSAMVRGMVERGAA